MIVKMFEIRDHGTFIPAVAVAMESQEESGASQERWLLRRAGYGGGKRCILLTKALGGELAYYDPYDWPNRTMKGAHLYIERHWDNLRSGDVVDARVGLGETEYSVPSERIQHP